MMILLRKYPHQKKKDFFQKSNTCCSNLVYLKILNTLLLSKRVLITRFLVIDLTCWCEKQTNGDANYQYR